jgi:hypothetical protein
VRLVLVKIVTMKRIRGPGGHDLPSRHLVAGNRKAPCQHGRRRPASEVAAVNDVVPSNRTEARPQPGGAVVAVPVGNIRRMTAGGPHLTTMDQLLLRSVNPNEMAFRPSPTKSTKSQHDAAPTH